MAACHNFTQQFKCAIRDGSETSATAGLSVTIYGSSTEPLLGCDLIVLFDVCDLQTTHYDKLLFLRPDSREQKCSLNSKSFARI